MKAFNVRNMILAALFTALTAIGAFIKIPIPPYPVPMTLQTAFLFLCGLLLPKREALLSQVAYVALGLIGIPIFTNGGGIGYVLDPTFGYLIAFVLAAPLLSATAGKTLYAGKKAQFAILAFCCILGINLLGTAYMSLLSAFYLSTPLPFSRALYILLIFLPLDAIKMLLAAMLALRLRKSVRSLPAL